MTKDTFKTEWSEKEQKAVERIILIYLKSRDFYSYKSPDKPCLTTCKSYTDINNTIGLAYTSSSSYAGLWVCSDNLYLDIDKTFHLKGFILDNNNVVYAIWVNSDENYLYIPVN